MAKVKYQRVLGDSWSNQPDWECLLCFFGEQNRPGS